MAPPEDGLVPTERTSLMNESPSSRFQHSPNLLKYRNESLPLTSSYEDLRGSMNRHLNALNKRPTKKWILSSTNNVLQRKHAIFILLCGCALSVMLLSLVNFHQPVANPGNNRIPGQPSPFSRLDPAKDLRLKEFTRPKETGPPTNLFDSLSRKHNSSKDRSPLPTNAWYQNMLMCRGEPSNLQRAYSIPYMVDVIGQVPGLRIHPNHVLSSDSVLQLSFNELFGLTLGAAADAVEISNPVSHQYKVKSTTELGLTLKWNAFNMKSSIVYGMPYATMIYEDRKGKTPDGKTMLPTIASRVPMGKPPVVDGTTELQCATGNPEAAVVDHELELYFQESDYSWLVVFSEPVLVQCVADDKTGHAVLQVVEAVEDCSSPLIIRTALLNSCTTGRNVNSCRIGLGDRQPEESQNDEFASLLRLHADQYPGEHSSFAYQIDESKEEANLVFNWDAKEMPSECRAKHQQTLRKLDETVEVDTPVGLLAYALPHHLDKFGSSFFPNEFRYCKSSIAGPTCLIEGSSWTMTESLPRVGLQAARPPRAEFIPQISAVLQDDINFSPPDYFMRGAGDTYFSGKMLAKLGRILLVAEEVNDVCSEGTGSYGSYCKNSSLLSGSQISDAVDRLRTAVEIWLNGNAEAPFVYDSAWGGVVSCGCYFNGNGCDNKAPDCPAFYDQGLNFGNGFYNDQHFHYGYHIYAAAILAHFDEQWGKEYFEQVLLLVRNIANPSKEDNAFPLFRHKDWFRGFSWASGVVNPPYLNGKNQESSSEAIAAYEAIAVYGQVMRDIWERDQDYERAQTSNEVMKVGQLMTATELRSAQKYWHVLQHVSADERIYPEVYNQGVVGILWTSMAQFGTWFGRAPYLPYGIQLLPLTPIAEERDDLRWANEIYYPFSQACSEYFQCTDSGWVILQLAILATVGYSNEAASRVKLLPDEAFTNAGGNGHSRTNTLWYLATRPIIEDPVPMDKSDFRGDFEKKPAPVFVLTDCHTPATCTDEVLDTKAGEYTCRERITWEINAQGKSQWEACSGVGGLEWPDICGLCAPGSHHSEKENDNEDGNKDITPQLPSLECPACTFDQCESDLNRCPVYDRTFVCTEGLSVGGCNGAPWTMDDGQCDACCELTQCQKLKDVESKKLTKDVDPLGPPKCPPCGPETCYGKVNQCPLHIAPFLCMSGASHGGCSATPWELTGEQCTECCEITVDC